MVVNEETMSQERTSLQPIEGAMRSIRRRLRLSALRFGLTMPVTFCYSVWRLGLQRFWRCLSR